MPRMLMQKVVPLGYAPVLALETYARRNNDKTTYNIVKIRASAINGCGYCIAMHTRDARKQGESDARIEALQTDWRAADLWSPAEETALALTDEVTRLGEDGVSDSTWDSAMEHWGEQGMGHLIIAISTINVWNRIAISTGLTAADL
ncbi:carboxymuconolactone decarboxylase family protein [uncultured Agrococcus sp.]|uniref:carboxymuconolactone decarboxylase family protein n=1 Tax=uncultured Agrococcus sp. TaxID=382258 RepID=UPI0025FDC6C8|nr:carboxymuconolactone decarboxylase family protein [uncultured Agrococcus sp.]